MKYNFDTCPDRTDTMAMKYDEREAVFGNHDCIPLWVADMDFQTAPCVIEALKKRAEHGVFGYNSRPMAFYEAVAGWQKKRHGTDFDPNLMSYAPGIVPGMKLCVELFTNPDDAVIIQQPVYFPFQAITESSGRKVVVSPLCEVDGQYVMNLEDFEQKVIENNVKLYILCNPHNPGGRVWTKEELQAVGDICVKHNVAIFSDEIHADLLRRGFTHTCMASISPKIRAITTTFTAASKTFNLAGLAVSTIIFPDITKKETYYAKMRELDQSRPNVFAYPAAMAAYEQGEDWLEELIDYLDGNLKFVHDYCEANIPGVVAEIPQATYLIWLDMRGLNLGQEELVTFCSQKAGLGFNNGATFGIGGEGFMRLNAACPRSTLEKAMKQLEEAVKSR